MLTTLRKLARCNRPRRSVCCLGAPSLVLVPKEVASVSAAGSEGAKLVVERDAVHYYVSPRIVPE